MCVRLQERQMVSSPWGNTRFFVGGRQISEHAVIRQPKSYSPWYRENKHRAHGVFYRLDYRDALQGQWTQWGQPAATQIPTFNTTNIAKRTQCMTVHLPI